MDPVYVDARKQEEQRMEMMRGADDEDSSLLMITPHENDTDDISLEQTPDGYDNHHSKLWNQMVNHKAVEIEQQIQIEENMKKAAEKARQESLEKAEMERIKRKKEKEARARQIELNRKLAEKGESVMSIPGPHQTIDMAELYSGISANDADTM